MVLQQRRLLVRLIYVLVFQLLVADQLAFLESQLNRLGTLNFALRIRRVFKQERLDNFIVPLICLP